MTWQVRRGRAHSFALWAVLLSLPAVTGCTDGDRPGDGRSFTVVTSTTVLQDLTLAVAGDDATVVSVVPVDTDPHVYEPTPNDARRIADADLLIANGANLEPWFAALARNASGPVVFIAEARPWLLLFEDDGEPDPHMWMAPTLAGEYVEVIADALADTDPAHAVAYRRRAATKQQQLTALDQELAALFDTLPVHRRVLVTSHDAFRYFGAQYGFTVASLYGVSTETQPSARDVQRLVELIRERDVPTIFVESTIERSVVERIARDANVAIGAPLYGDALGPPGSTAESYVQMMRHNAQAIVDGLTA